MVFEGQTVLVSFTPYRDSMKIQSEWWDLKQVKSWIFFCLMEPSRSKEGDQAFKQFELRLLAHWHTLELPSYSKKSKEPNVNFVSLYSLFCYHGMVGQHKKKLPLGQKMFITSKNLEFWNGQEQ